MATPNRPASQNKYPEQYMNNTSFDEDFGVNAVEALSYNPSTGNLERQNQTVAADVRFDTDDSAPVYIGVNSTLGAATSAATWVIYKFTYSGSAVTRVQRQIGIWDNRAALSW